MANSCVFDWDVRKCSLDHICLQRVQRRWAHQEGTYGVRAAETQWLTKLQSTINAMTLVSFAIGNICGSEIFLSKDAPQYIPGKVVIMVLLSVQLVVSFILRWINIRLNKKKAAFLVAEQARRQWSDADLQRERDRHAFMDLTDKQYVRSR
jgi:ACS family allantoate permease-like MFS transporter